MSCTVVVGGFFGDEGKGKIIAYLADHDKPSINARGGVGPNAGHTVVHNGCIYSLRMIPSGFICKKTRLLIGPGVLVNASVLQKEIGITGTRGRVGLDHQCAIIEERHILDEIQSRYLSQKIGTTKSGVGMCNAERVLRKAKLARDFPDLKEYTTDVSDEIHRALDRKDNVLIEGTQGTFLSLYHGTYPFCTTKDVCASAICSDVGCGPKDVSDVIVVFKTYVTRVGEGPLENQLPREEVIRRGWMEKGTVTGRERRAAPFDFQLARRAVELNGGTEAAITKLDVAFEAARGAKSFDQLPKEVRAFVEKVEEEIRVPVTLLGTGPSSDEIIDRRKKA